MKKLLFLSLMAAAAAGCTNDEPAVEPVSKTVFNGLISSSDYALVDLGTRAAADEGLVKFQAGEEIGLGGDVLQYSVFTAADNGAMTTLTGAVAPVWGQTPGTYKFWAVAPYVAEAAQGEFKVSVPTEQTIVDGKNTSSIVLVGQGTAEYDGATDPESVDITFRPCNSVLELSIPGSGMRLAKIEIEPVSEQDMTGGFGFEASVNVDGTVNGKSEGKRMSVDFRTGQNNYMTLTNRSAVKLPVGDFTIASGEGLKFTFTMDDGTVRIRTISLEEDLSSTDVDNGAVIYKHLKLGFETLDQTINIFNETFGEPKDGTLLVKNTKQRQLVNYFAGFTPEGVGSSSAAYWGGLRVDLQHGTRFETENENDGYLYFGNANNGGLGTDDKSLASFSAIYDYNEAHPAAHINDDLTLYVYNVNVGAATEAVVMSFDVAYNTYASLIEKNGEDNSLFARWIKVEYTPDFGDTWIDISGDCSVENQTFRYISQRVDLTSYNDQFISFRITPRFKQTLLLDNLSFDILGDPAAIEANSAPSVVEIYRQTPSTAYLMCRPAAGRHMTEAEMRAVVPHMCVAGGNLQPCDNFEIYRADEKHQVFEIIVRGIPQYLNERWVALESAGEVGGKKSFYESGSNELINVNFDHFIAGTDAIGSIKLGHRMLNWHSVFSVGGSANAGKDENLGGFAVMHDPLMNIREIEYRQEQGATFTAGGDGYMTSNTFRIGNNMEASFRGSEGFYDGADITTDGAINDGKFFRFECELDGWHGLLMYGVRGYMQLGTGSTTWYGDETASKQVWIRTPALGERAAGKSVELRFDVARYNDKSCQELTIVVENGGTFANGQTTKNVSCGSTADFTTNTVEITGCTAQTKIKIGPASASAYPGGYGRFFIDNIRVVL